MTVLPLSLSCPACGSKAVTYSCTPDCCFNHVCDSCLTSFEPKTAFAGREIKLDIEPQERDPCAPTVPCARCGSLQVYLARDDDSRVENAVCVSCNAVLEVHSS